MGGTDNSAGARLSRFVVEKWFIALPIAVLLTLASATGFPYLKPNFTHTSFFWESDELLQRFNQFERQFGNDDAVILVVESPSGIFDVESAELMRTLTAEMWQIPDVIQVESISNFSWVHAKGDDIVVEPLLPELEELTPELLAERKKVALEHELLPDYLVSQDGTIGLIFGKLKPGIDAPPNTEVIIGATRDLIEKYQGGDHSFHITGGPAINNSFREASVSDQQRLLPIVFLIVALFLAFSFRTIGGVVMPFVVIFFSVVAAFALFGWLHFSPLKTEINTITTVLPQILVAIGVADSVHILAYFFRARRRGMKKRAAAIYALEKNFLPTLLTSVSTAIGFFAFSTADLKPISGLGFVAGVGTLYAWFITYFVLGPFLAVAPSWVKLSKEEEQEAESVQHPSEFGWKVTRVLDRYKYPIIAVYSVATIAAVVLASQVRINSDPYKYFALGVPLREAQDFVLEHLGGVPNFETVVDSGKDDGIKDPEFLKKVEELEKTVIAEVDGINRSVSIVDILRQTNRSLNGGSDEFYRLPDDRELIAQEKFLYEMSLPQGRDINAQVTIKNDALRISFVSTISDSETWTETAAWIEGKAAELGLDAQVTGKSMLYQSMNGYVVESFVSSLTIAVVLISLLLVVFFRSFRIGGIALLPNLIPLVIGGAVLRLIGADLDIGTVLVASVCLGIAVDDTIHIMANFNRYLREGRPVNESVAMIVTNTGPALITTTIVLVCGFGTLTFGTFVPLIYFGLMTAVVLTTALLTDLTFLPALLMLFPPASKAEIARAEENAPAPQAAAG